MPAIKMSEIRSQYPEYNDLSDDQLLIGLHKAKFAHLPMRDFLSEVERDTERDRLMRENADSLSLPDRWAANWSAGYGNLTQGLQQLISKTGAVSPVSDEDIRGKRERDKYLARNWGDKAMQIGGEVMPFMGIPAPGLPAAVGPVTGLLASGGIGGAASAAISPVTSDESRGMNMAAGGILGTVLPGGGQLAAGALRGGRNLLTQGGARTRALAAIQEQIPTERAAQLAQQLARTPKPTLRGQEVDVPITAAQATGDPYLAKLEAASRSRPTTQPGWADFDSGQNASRYRLLSDLTPSEQRIERLAAVRNGRTAPMREAALAQAGKQVDLADPVTQRALDLISGASGANPAVKNVASYVARELGPDAVVTPARLYEVRKTLAAKLSGPAAIGDELAASAKGASRETQGLIASIDQALDAASAGQWSPYLSEYASRSRPITSGRAMRDVFEKIDAKPLRGNTPEVTYAGLNSAARATEGRYGDKLQPQVRGDMDAFLDNLRTAEGASRSRKAAATMGGGSITNSDQLLAAFTTKLIDSLPMVGGYAERVSNINRQLVEEHMARMLQSPTQLGAALREMPPNLREQLASEALRGLGVSAGAGVTP
jgi:hypothetical protein